MYIYKVTIEQGGLSPVHRCSFGHAAKEVISMRLSEIDKKVEQATGRKLTIGDLLKKQDHETWKKVLRRSTTQQK